MSRFRTFAWAALALVIGVILWGALVRATGSGAGCGSHWPTCNGAIVPRAASTETFIELTHRITSGLAALGVGVMLFWARRLYPRGHRVRRAAGWSCAFMLGEVLIGAGIVLLEYVAQNASMGRAVWMAVHLVNTFLLLGAMTLLAHYAGGAQPVRLRGGASALAWAAIGGTLFVGVSGAVAALGDTLFPADTLSAGLAADLSPAAHVLVKLRVVHPFAALALVALLLITHHALTMRRPEAARFGMWLRLGVLLQIGAGLANLFLLAPVWLQIVHLFLADLVWIALVLFVAAAFAAEEQRSQVRREQTREAVAQTNG
ncbi:MAG TPA: COX15/CtaA family protein [Polyangiaceae bacterium]|nr:COX15/CtaA family protein [Polyangiaceae bacterium]